jgi:hypothetical protein
VLRCEQVMFNEARISSMLFFERGTVKTRDDVFRQSLVLTIPAFWDEQCSRGSSNKLDKMSDYARGPFTHPDWFSRSSGSVFVPGHIENGRCGVPLIVERELISMRSRRPVPIPAILSSGREP